MPTKTPSRVGHVVQRKNPALKLDRGDFSMIFHTALRKGCDSTSSSLLWNLIYMGDPIYTARANPRIEEAYSAFKDVVYKPFLKANTTDGRVALLKAAASELDFGTHEKNLIMCAFQMLTDDDWLGIVCYFEYCYK